MRALLVILAFLFAGNAFALTQPQRAAILYGAPLSPAPTPAPQPGITLGPDNSFQASAYNAGITLPSTSMYLTPGGTGWVYIMKVRYDDQAGTGTSGTNPFTLASNCGYANCAITCPSAVTGYRTIEVGNPKNGTVASQNQLFINVARSTNQAWIPSSAGCQTGIYLVPNNTYTIVLAQYPSGFMSVSANDQNGNPATGSPAVTSTTANNTSGGTNFYYAGTGTPITAATLGNLFNQIGTSYTGTTANQSGTASAISDVAMLTGVLTNSSATPDANALKAISNGSQTVAQWATAQGLSIQAWYQLNNPSGSPPTFAEQAARYGTANAFGTIATEILPASPITPLPCLTLTEQGQGDIERVDPGQTLSSPTGTFHFRGTISAASCGFPVTAVQGQVLNASGTPVSGWTTFPVTAGAYSGAISGIAASTSAGTYYTLQVRPKRSPSYVLSGKYQHYIGDVFLVYGQSQQGYCFTPGTTGSGSGSQLTPPTAAPVADIFQNLADTGNPATNLGFGHPALTPLTAYNNPGSASSIQMLGDCAGEFLVDFQSVAGHPIKLVAITKNGQPADSWAYDYLPMQQTLGGSGPYTGTLSIANSTTPTPITGGATTSNFVQEVKPGTLTVSYAISGTPYVVTDVQGGAMFTSGGTAGTISGTGISAGTINYLTGAVSVTFSSAPDAAPVARWTEIQDVQYANYSLHTSANGYISGYGTFGDGVNSTSGYSTAVLNRMSGPPSAIDAEQCTANASDIVTFTPPATNTGAFAALQAKDQYLFASKIGGFWWASANTPVLVEGYPRYAGTLPNQTQSCQQYLRNLGAYSGAGITTGQYQYVGDYHDDLVQCTAATNCLSPHPGPYVMGGRRVGRRKSATFLCAIYAYQCSAVTEPTITGCARVSTTITCTVNLPNGTSIANCGATWASGITAANITPTNGPTCVTTTTAATAVSDMMFGATASTMYNYDGVNIGNATVIDDTKKFTCVIATATTFTCTASWFSGSLVWTYGQTGLFEAGYLKAVTITAPGTGYTNGATATFTGGTCSTEPTGIIASTAGLVTAIARKTPGACTVAPTGFTGGSGSSATVTTTIWTPTDDFNNVGNLLYDNSAGCMGTISAVTYEPGCIVAPVSIPQTVN